MNKPKNPVAPVVNFVKRNQTRILIATTVASTASAVVLGTGVKKHNEFLKEHGLFEQFYDLANTTEA